MDWQRDVSPTRPSSSRASSSTSSRTRSSSSPRRATSRTCRPARRRSTSPTGSTPTSATACIGAKVNNRLVPLDYRLKNGDIVEIVTTKGEHGPSRDWLNVVRTSPRPGEDPPMVQAPGARREHRPRPRVARARAPAARPEAHPGGRPRPDRRGRPSSYNYETLDDFYAAIGYGAVSAQQVVMRLGVVDDTEVGAADGRAADSPGADRRRPGQGRRRPARPVRASAATRSRATRSRASSPAARA